MVLTISRTGTGGFNKKINLSSFTLFFTSLPLFQWKRTENYINAILKFG